MRVLLSFTLGLSVLAGFWYVFILNADPTSKQVISLLRENDPQLADADVTLDGCQLSIRTKKAVSDDGPIVIGALEANLKALQLQTVRISEPGNSRASLIIPRKPANDDLVKQTKRVTDFLPDNLKLGNGVLTMLPNSGGVIQEQPVEFSGGARLSQERLRQILSQPNKALNFRFTTVVTATDVSSTEEAKSQQDAAGFVEFANDVMSLDGPLTYSAGLVFKGKMEPETLLAGLVTIPKELTFAAASHADARSLGETLFRYAKAACPP